METTTVLEYDLLQLIEGIKELLSPSEVEWVDERLEEIEECFN